MRKVSVQNALGALLRVRLHEDDELRHRGHIVLTAVHAHSRIHGYALCLILIQHCRCDALPSERDFFDIHAKYLP